MHFGSKSLENLQYQRLNSVLKSEELCVVSVA